MDQAFVFVVLITALVLFVWGRWRYDLVALATLLVLVVAGIIDGAEAFLGFGHPAVVTVAAVLVISAALERAGVVDLLARWISRAGSNPVLQVAALTLIVAIASAFINNVGALALFMPVAIRLARENDRPASVLLMPLAFGSLLGGLTTLIGTPPKGDVLLLQGSLDAIHETLSGMGGFRSPSGASRSAGGASSSWPSASSRAASR